MISMAEDDDERRGKCGRGRDLYQAMKVEVVVVVLVEWWCGCDVTIFLRGGFFVLVFKFFFFLLFFKG